MESMNCAICGDSRVNCPWEALRRRQNAIRQARNFIGEKIVDILVANGLVEANTKYPDRSSELKRAESIEDEAAAGLGCVNAKMAKGSANIH